MVNRGQWQEPNAAKRRAFMTRPSDRHNIPWHSPAHDFIGSNIEESALEFIYTMLWAFYWRVQ